MKIQRTPIASAVALLLTGVIVTAHAQDAAPPASPASAASAAAGKTPQKLETVVITGIRGSLQQSLSVKRNAASNVEVVTAEDVGKMPDKNVADSLSRLPGVNISTSAAGSGGFDENDRVSLRGTPPSLTQTLINGHAMSSGDWFVLDQVGGAVGRSSSYSLLPSEIVGQVVVKKTPTADLVEGGTAGTVDVLTRRPLDFRQTLTLEGSAQMVHSTLANKSDPQLSMLGAWKNDAGNVGVLAQVFSEKRHLRRDGQELLQWNQIGANNQVAKDHPDLAGVWYPRLIGSSLFEQERKREGGLLDVQFKPTSDLTLDATFFKSTMNASNYNRNYMTDIQLGSGLFNGNAAPVGGVVPGVSPDRYTVFNGILTSADWANKGTSTAPLRYGVVDDIVRNGAKATTQFFDLDAAWKANSALSFRGKIGSTKGTGETPKQGVYEGDIFNTGLSYSLNGLGSPASVSFPNGNTGNFAGTSLDWVFGYSPATTLDKEQYAQIDGEYALDAGMLTGVKFGLRGTKHDRSNFAVAQGPNWAADPFNPANAPAWNGETYPGNFGSDLGGNFPKNVWMIDRNVLDAWGDKYSNRSTDRTYYPDMFSLTEKTTAAYISADLEGQGWSGNIGTRIVNTRGTTHLYQILPADTGGLPAFPWGGFVAQTDIHNNYTDFLPSLNLRFDVSKDVVARFAVSRTMTRPDFGALAGTVSLTDETLTGNGGNAYLKPVVSNNYDATVQWYYAPRALLSAGLFVMDMKSYVGYGKYKATFINATQSEKQGKPVFNEYEITAPINVGAQIKGLEFAAQVPVGAGFGLDGNMTIADSKQAFGTCGAVALNTTSSPCDVLGASKLTYNVGAFFENDKFNARIGWSWRSSYLAALDRGTPLYQDDFGSLSVAANYAITQNLTATFSGQNVNNPILKNYIFNKDMPARFYANGAQYYLGIRYKY